MTYEGVEYTDCIKYAASCSTGLALEFGVASGRTLKMIAQNLPVVGFDSFEGLPEDWREEFPKGAFACDVPNVPGAEIVVGWFDVSVPKWIAENKDRLEDLSLVHIDCDLYSSTKTVLNNLRPYLKSGVLVVFDEYHGYPGAEYHEELAWKEFTSQNGIKWEVVGTGPEQMIARIL